MNREDKIIKLAKKIESITGLFKMFPEQIDKKGQKNYANNLRDLADELEKL